MKPALFVLIVLLDKNISDFEERICKYHKITIHYKNINLVNN